MLDGRAEIADASLGGERQTNHRRGSENKVSFVVAVQTTADGLPVALRMDPVSITTAGPTDSARQALSTSLCTLPDALACAAATVVQAISNLAAAISGIRRSLDFDK